jgi:ABC-type antimicrobial peptide transport system permease subunit
MQLGKALVGAIIGAAVGIGMLIAVYTTLGLDKFWLAIPFAIITGLGVRMLVSTSGHASYARGVLTMLIAMAAYFVGWTVVAQVATARANKEPVKPIVKVEETAETDATDTDAPKEETPPPPVAPPRNVNAPAMRPAAPSPSSPWDIIWLAVAALCAYELGRGSGMPTTPATTPAEPVPMGTHPDA